jgi:transcriptional regulator with XRE-family HTH domain
MAVNAIVAMKERHSMDRNIYSGDEFAAWRKDSGLTPTECAIRLSIDYTHLWRVETSRQRPGWSLMLRILRLTKGAVTPMSFSNPLMTNPEEPDPQTGKRSKRAA